MNKISWVSLFVMVTTLSCSKELAFSGRLKSDPDFSLLELDEMLVAGDRLTIQPIVPDTLERGWSIFSFDGLPFGFDFSSADGSVRWESDFQDIGKRIRGEYSVSNSAMTHTAQYNVQVVSPAIETHFCRYDADPVIGDVKPVMKWHWNGWKSFGPAIRYFLTYSSPAVGDLDKDRNIEVVTIASSTNYRNTNGPLVVLSGRTGEPLWNTMDPPVASFDASTTPALADLDGDGYSEIVGASVLGPDPDKPGSFLREILILDYQKKRIRSRYADGFQCERYCQVALGDIDNDGKIEIVAGNVVLSNLGERKEFLDPPPIQPEGFDMTSTTTLADLIPGSDQPGLEIVVNGSQIYSSKGKKVWEGDCVGYSAVSDLEQDGSPELVCVGVPRVGSALVNGKVLGAVYAYRFDGTLLWKKAIPNDPAILANNHGGPPGIGNFLGGPEMEIGLAGGEYYFVLDRHGNLVWFQPTKDHSSNKTGSTVFDFNGDGLVEVIYNDEEKLRIYDGRNGVVLWETLNLSGTLFEYPVIANIDEDASVEIIVSSPGNGGMEQDYSIGGIRTFDDPTSLWVSSRSLWNQYSYYPEIISDGLSSPPPVANLGELPFPKEGFRVNRQGALRSGGSILIPDLALGVPRFRDDPTQGGGDALSFLVKNVGEAPSPIGVPITLSGEIFAAGILAHTQTAIAPGMTEVVKLEVGKRVEPGTPLVARVGSNSNGPALFRECGVENNTVSFTMPVGRLRQTSE